MVIQASVPVRPLPFSQPLTGADRVCLIDRFTHDHLPSTYDLFLTPDRSPAVLDAYRSGSVHSQPPMETRYILRALRTLEGGKMIGNLDLFPVTEENRWEIAYDLDPEYWGQGLGSMMVGFLVQWAGCTGVKVVSAVSSPHLRLSLLRARLKADARTRIESVHCQWRFRAYRRQKWV